MTRNDALDLVALLVAHYPAQAKLAPENVNAFVASLTLYSRDHGRQAVERVVRSSVWFPSVAAVVTEIVEVAMGLPTPENAWLLLLERQRTGDRKEPLAPTIRIALDAAGGTHAMQTNATHLVRKAFIESYAAARQQLADRMRETELPRLEREWQARLSPPPPAPAEAFTEARKAVEDPPGTPERDEPRHEREQKEKADMDRLVSHGKAAG